MYDDDPTAFVVLGFSVLDDLMLSVIGKSPYVNVRVRHVTRYQCVDWRRPARAAAHSFCCYGLVYLLNSW